jgi:hypothetical protein
LTAVIGYWWRLLLGALLAPRLIAADTVAPAVGASAKAARRILTATDFVDKEMGADSSGAPGTLWVQINSNLPPYRFELAPSAERGSTETDDVLMGKIRIFREGTAAPVQTISVWGADPARFTTSFRMCDMNFDGYLDLVEFHVAGAKWGSESYWLFDPGSGRFITNTLTAQLGELMYQDIAVNPAKAEIRISLWIGLCMKSFEVYRVERGKLVLVESEIHMPEDAHHCMVTRKKRTGQKLVTLPAVRVKHPEH